MAGLLLVGEVVIHVGLYGSKVAGGCLAVQRRSCLKCKCALPIMHYKHFGEIIAVSHFKQQKEGDAVIGKVFHVFIAQ